MARIVFHNQYKDLLKKLASKKIVPNDRVVWNGYIGSVSYSETDNKYYGKISRIDDLVSYEGESRPELLYNFISAASEYDKDIRRQGLC